jgi:hypothetical protein
MICFTVLPFKVPRLAISDARRLPGAVIIIQQIIKPAIKGPTKYSRYTRDPMSNVGCHVLSRRVVFPAREIHTVTGHNILK